MTAAAGGAVAGGVAAAAAAHQAMLMRREEEEMTAYSDQDLAGDWEFKILRSASGAFRKPEEFRKACQEEARAGWILVEKFDDSRLRFKRLRSAGSGDDGLQQDPYRTRYGMGEGKLAAVILVAVFGSLAVIGAIVAIVVKL